LVLELVQIKFGLKADCLVTSAASPWQRCYHCKQHWGQLSYVTEQHLADSEEWSTGL